MAYLHGATAGLGSFGCGSGCSCASCRTPSVGETYERSTVGEPPPALLPGETSCPKPAGWAVDRCRTRHPCPAIPNLICMRSVGGVPFEYVDRVRVDPATGLRVPSSAIGSRPPRQQRFIPAVRDALARTLVMLDRWSLPVEAILTAGALYCRCIKNTDQLSNHSFGDAVDIVGVRWRSGRNPGSRLAETIMHNYLDPGERALLVRLNAALRLAFVTVIDYTHPDHRDHFHCDLGRGRGVRGLSRGNIRFAQEALSRVLGRPVPSTGGLDAATRAALDAFARRPAGTTASRADHWRTMESLFRYVGSAGRER